ncbi:outer membrane lipoprotein-sorting protein [Ectobacillus ponti]|uniref:Outer membrane lipoprotein-sorting protein n=1 Tax=Ectobacillus ponti TaxID=2961894 RepID=A0AA42BQ44_9BACI|nr:outer membrane lipoprotein-sorting protein [Ectobacillus ponti]MCP8968049.1 outer membrane lipoprotein-sorting protein [Ectobacillus ponti]
MKKKTLLICLISAGIAAAGGAAVFSKSSQGSQGAISQAELCTPAEKLSAKKELKKKMLDSLQYFDTAKGTVAYGNRRLNLAAMSQYELRTKGTPFLYEKTTQENGASEEVAFDGKETVIQVDHQKKAYKQQIVEQTPDDLLQAEQISLRAADMVNGILKNEDQWDVVSEESILGLPVFVVQGELGKELQKRDGASTLKVWIHKDTGIVLRMEEYNQKGEPVIYVSTQSITINGPVDESKGKLVPPSDYQSM